MAVVAEVSVEAGTSAGGVVADALIGAVDLTEIAAFPCVFAVLGRHIVAVRLHRTGARIIRRRAVTCQKMCSERIDLAKVIILVMSVGKRTHEGSSLDRTIQALGFLRLPNQPTKMNHKDNQIFCFHPMLLNPSLKKGKESTTLFADFFLLFIKSDLLRCLRNMCSVLKAMHYSFGLVASYLNKLRGQNNRLDMPIVDMLCRRNH